MSKMFLQKLASAKAAEGVKLTQCTVCLINVVNYVYVFYTATLTECAQALNVFSNVILSV